MKSYLYFLLLLSLLVACSSSFDVSDEVNYKPVIYPDYTDIVIPVNIAPLNFKVDGKTDLLAVEVKAGADVVSLKCRKGKAVWNNRQWRSLLNAHVGDTLFYTVTMSDSAGKVVQFAPFWQVVSPDSIDSHIAYRLINTGYVLWDKMGIYERCLENFNQKPIIENQSVDIACMNCHSFSAQNPNTMLLHTRKFNGGTTILYDGKLQKFNTKTNISMSAGVYPSWNPNGYLIAMSTNLISQQFHNDYGKRIYVSDSKSDIVLLNVKTQTLTTCPQLSTKDLENLPAWAPDGRTLYYTSAPERKGDKGYDVGYWYSLLRITYDEATNSWGTADTVLRAKDLGGSITFPKVSPNGRYIAFTFANRGYFTPFNREADIYLLDLHTMQIAPQPNVNSDCSESNHGWSHNGHWLVVGSKWPDGVFTKPYFAHFDGNGNFSKRFLLPQEDPDFYDDFTLNYNNTDFITGEVPTTPIQWRDAIKADPIPVKADPSVDIDALSGATMKAEK
ncbi:MAG: PD40 domain-containing protein [Salinivirgaceae bacterium]|nr:PD40 domain-containing protein [Salinivirgaceae bacterium]MBR3568817.1 PD40 domain-containing protein [Salinivirgaceae bacterium]MBR4620125.1 PD40 domain-containing protein [Salinivirgaceae bacterium]